MPGNFHRAIESLAADSFVYQPLPFGFTRRDGHAHEDVHERGWHADGAWQPLRAAGTGEKAKVRLREADLVVPLLGDADIAGERQFECTGQARARNGGNDRFGHALAHRDGPVNESRLGPLATGSAHRFREADEFRYRIVTNKRTGRSACYDDDANVSVASALVERLEERVARLLVDIDPSCAAEGNDGDSVDYSCCQNVGVHPAPQLESPSLGARATLVLEQSRHICHLCFRLPPPGRVHSLLTPSRRTSRYRKQSMRWS